MGKASTHGQTDLATQVSGLKAKEMALEKWCTIFQARIQPYWGIGNRTDMWA